jgi:hypothetical protein
MHDMDWPNVSAVEIRLDSGSKLNMILVRTAGWCARTSTGKKHPERTECLFHLTAVPAVDPYCSSGEAAGWEKEKLARLIYRAK